MCRKVYTNFLISFFLLASFKMQAQLPYFKGAIKENREKFYNGLISANIKAVLSLPLNAENEEAWIDAFHAINLTKYETPAVINKISFAAKNINRTSNDFKKTFISLLNSDFPGKYSAEIKPLFFSADDDDRLLAMAANYLLPTASPLLLRSMQERVSKKLKADPTNAILLELNEQLKKKKIQRPSLHAFFAKDYLPGQVIVFSFQRRDRNYPGLAIVRKADGTFLKNDDGDLFSVGQLARSESNMPGYISLGNTPQGIFRMDGFDTSKSYFIGPTTNIQLTLPFEYKASHFYRDNNLADSIWTLAQYQSLLPQTFKNYRPLHGTYYAGMAGRNEIIAHGTTIDPAFFSGRKYYPYSPTEGCLVTKEEWNETTGYLRNSDQIKLTEAVSKAGGPYGYLILIELDDKKVPVTPAEILHLL